MLPLININKKKKKTNKTDFIIFIYYLFFSLIELNDTSSDIKLIITNFYKCTLTPFAKNTLTQKRFISANSGFEVKSGAKIKVSIIINNY